MPRRHHALVTALAAALVAALVAVTAPLPGAAQSVLVDEGTFTVWLAGREAGSEEFAIRRAGMGGDATVIANAVVRMTTDAGQVVLRPLLETVLPDGAATSYQLEVSGSETAELSLALAGRRYVSRIRTQEGEEEREYLARPETRILEEGVAHQYYFLRNVREGARVPVIEPRTRRQLQLVASAPADEELRLGATSIPARRVTFSGGGAERVVWYDRQGRVLRIEIPARGYVAERQDLVG
jgi:hypothetical protein